MTKNKVKYGDMFQIGDHVLICGDATDLRIVEKVAKGIKIKAVISDFPYGIDYVASKRNFSQVKVDKDIINDGLISEKVYAKFTEDLIKPIIPHLASKNAFYLFNGDKQILALREGMEKSGVHYSQTLLWAKSQPVIGRKDYLSMTELIGYGWFGKHKFRSVQDKSVLFCPKPSKNSYHPTQKPLKLMRQLILNSTNINDYVYDPCAGSGSTGIACEQSLRKCVMIEMDPEYCQKIIDRFRKKFEIKTREIKINIKIDERKK